MNFNQNNTTITMDSTLSAGSNLVYSGNTSNWAISEISISEELTDFFELVLAALGYDISYNDFKKMSKQERNQLIREIKLKTIL
jgi:hypothetical protein